MKSNLTGIIKFIESKNAIKDKNKLTKLVSRRFKLIRDRSVYYNDEFAIRICKSARPNLSNTILSLSNLRKVDDRPFIVCVVTPDKNYMYLANSTFLSKISHSSQLLRTNNIKGSFNGSDIRKEFNGYKNEPDNFAVLFDFHKQFSFEENLARLVEATNDIHPSGKKLELKDSEIKQILAAPLRAQSFVNSNEYIILKEELDTRVKQYRTEILIASLIENSNIRSAVIEYLIAGNDDSLRKEIIKSLNSGKGYQSLTSNKHSLGDYSREFANFLTETDVKTKIMVLDSNPKAYNIDKILEFLTKERTVFMFYFVGIDYLKNSVKTTLISMFQKDLCNSIFILSHWSGRNSRGVTQFDGKVIKKLILNPDNSIDIKKAQDLLKKLIEL